MKKTQTSFASSRAWRFAGRCVSYAFVFAGIIAALPLSQAQEKHFAYSAPAGLAGNQDLSSAPTIALGYDFDVVNEINLTRLGAFDDDQNGFGANTVMTVRIWDRAAKTNVVSVQFTQASPGELVGSLRFKPLDAPVRLARGFKGVVSLEGYNAEEWALNSMGNLNAIVWTLDSGNGSIAFVGTSRVGTDTPPAFPNGPDGGPAARYLAGSFEYETTTLTWPATPVLSVVATNLQINLTWQAITNPVPAAKYRISRSASPSGPFTQLAEVTTTNYSDVGLASGTEYSYVVAAVTAADNVGFPSDVKTASVFIPAANTYIAYDAPGGLNGNQDLSSVPTISLGYDFDVVNDIVIKRLGAFDDDQNGFGPDTVMTVRIWSREAQTNVLSTNLVFVEFTQASPGDLVGSIRFKPLETPLTLPRGFKGVVSLEGYNAQEWALNSHGDVNAVVWKLNSGNGSLDFVGTSRVGTATPPAYPDGPDGGPAARYSAGSFEFETTTLTWPGKPVVAISTTNQSINLAWTVVTNPVAAAKYRISRSESPTGPFTQLTEVTNNTYSNTGVEAGKAYSYIVEAVTADNKVGFASDVKTAAVYIRTEDTHVAYYTEPSTPGNQALAGNLGFDFDVQNAIIVKRLGVFDQDSDGIKGDLTARIYNRDTQEVLAELSFGPDDQGILIGSHRFKDLSTPLRLEAGFKGVIAAAGFGTDDQIWNSRNNPAAVRWTFDNGKGSIQFVGTSRLNSFEDNFPDAIQGGGVARWAAGSFEFQSLAAERPGTPLLTVVHPFQDKLVTLSWPAVTNPLPAVKYEITRTGTNGVAAKIGETTEVTYRDTNVENGFEYCYTVRAVAAGGQTSADSATMCATPAPRIGGIAYINPDTILGNQNVTGASVGMDFDVAFPIRVTQLGAFDSDLNGFLTTITVAIFNRDSTAQPVVTLQLTPESPGDLNGGSRLKALPQPLQLSAGFKGSIVTWGYNLEEQMYNTFGTPNPELQVFEGGSIVFVGSSRYGSSGSFPATVDTGPLNRFAAGTFAFEPEAATPEIRLQIARSGANVKITWEGGGTLQRSETVNTGWQNVPGAVSGVEYPVSSPNTSYFRVSK